MIFCTPGYYQTHSSKILREYMICICLVKLIGTRSWAQLSMNTYQVLKITPKSILKIITRLNHRWSSLNLIGSNWQESLWTATKSASRLMISRRLHLIGSKTSSITWLVKIRRKITSIVTDSSIRVVARMFQVLTVTSCWQIYSHAVLILWTKLSRSLYNASHFTVSSWEMALISTRA